MFRKKALTARKKATQERSNATVEAILTAAAHVLEQLGFDGSTTNRIAERAGVSIGSLYQYFPNKDALAGALIDRLVRNHSNALESRLVELRDKPLSDLTRAMSEDVLAVFFKNRTLMRTVGTLIPGLNRIPVIVESRRRFIRIFAEELKARKSEITHPDPDAAAYALVNGAMGIVQMHLFEEPPPLSPERLQLEFERMMYGYLTQKPSEHLL